MPEECAIFIIDQAVNNKNSGEDIEMSSKEKNAVRLLDTKLDAKTTKTMVICAVIMLVSVLIHDGDHIR